VLGRYRPLFELGQGGTANVYLAVAHGPSGFNKLVVLKVLKGELASESSYRSMFLREARLAGRLNHPNIVQTYEVFEEDGRPVIVMEYLEGQPLSRITARGEGTPPLPLAMHLRIICEALNGLHYAHELTDFDGKALGVVHRDMTPHNVFVAYEGRVAVLDFGIAKLQGAGPETNTGVIKGKLRYMPPEQLKGETVDRRADIFAVGVMLWEAVTGEKMWRGLSDAAIMDAILKGNIPSPRTVRAEVTEELERICMKALAPDRADRHASAAELEADLESALAGQSESASLRGIGQFVSTQFRETRSKTRSIIDRQLADAPSKEQAKRLDEWLLPSVALTLSRAENAQNAAARAGASRRSPLVGVGVAVAVALAGSFALWRVRPVPSPAVVATSAPSPQSPPVLPSAAVSDVEVTVHLSASPANAKLYLDDAMLDANPYSKSMPADRAPHKLRAEAPGYTPETAVITFAQNADVSLTLERAQPSHAPSARARAAASGGAAKIGAANAESESKPPGSAAPAQGGAPAASKPDCDPPYVIEESGIRRLKPECL
jgi:eukaryotic-like serine/threonine-protein kinase